ncbi:unnamed protein product, partial [Rotaria magnacalcarata]
PPPFNPPADTSNHTTPFSLGNQRSRKKSKQIQNLSRLYEIGTIGLKQYLTGLSFLVGDSSSVKNTKKR